ncbi:GAF domain-containing protein [Clostridium peptidivorans]|uniref:GAF domain-containing protein n=1 Tax=Clostridium peptidivorans TaxID=100174 RepID=UPI000BE43371|nr:GAF domain-containing protein [Clostridium peptidivorans]
MFDLSVFDNLTQKQKYESLLSMMDSLLKDETDVIANLSNASALIKALVSDVNWAGFYIIKNNELVLGPFQGLPACNRIQAGKGVCGTSALKGETMLVKNVHSFPGHIACDSQSNSEIVIPLKQNNKVYGVLDLDSPTVGRFDEEDKIYLEKAVEIINKYVNWEEIN